MSRLLTGCQHTLNIVPDITEYYSVALLLSRGAGSLLGSQGLDLKTLEDGYGISLVGICWIAEDGAE